MSRDLKRSVPARTDTRKGDGTAFTLAETDSTTPPPKHTHAHTRTHTHTQTHTLTHTHAHAHTRTHTFTHTHTHTRTHTHSHKNTKAAMHPGTYTLLDCPSGSTHTRTHIQAIKLTGQFRVGEDGRTHAGTHTQIPPGARGQRTAFPHLGVGSLGGRAQQGTLRLVRAPVGGLSCRSPPPPWTHGASN